MSEPVKSETDLALVKKHLHELIEHGDFDTVHIFATRHQPENKDSGTISLQIGLGSWFARYGQVRAWLIEEEEKLRDDMREK